MAHPFPGLTRRASLLLGLLAITACSLVATHGRQARAEENAPDPTAPPSCDNPAVGANGANHCFTTEFRADECTFSSTGRNPFFVLVPGFTLEIQGEEDREDVHLTITVLDDTRMVDGVQTRVIEERELHDGEIAEVSRNFFAICKETGSAFYFGEETDIYEDGAVVGHEGSWLAGEDGARAGIVMPGTVLLGSRYYQEVAPGTALDRAEIVRMGVDRETPAGEFAGCIVTLETTPLEPYAKEAKVYAPRVGLIVDGPLELVSYVDPGP